MSMSDNFLDKEFSNYYFSYLSMKTYVVGIKGKILDKTREKSTQ